MKFALSTIFLGSALHATSLFYAATPCGGAGQTDCAVTPASHDATRAEMARLNDHLFNNWLSDNFGNAWTDSTFSLSGVKAVDRYMVGLFTSASGFASSFIYQPGGLICCTLDGPFQIRDINDNGLVTGFTPLGGWFVDEFTNLHADYTPSSPRFASGFRPDFAGQFVAIDDQNRILLRQAAQNYILTPNPEPGTLGLMLFGLVLIAAGIKKGRPS